MRNLTIVIALVAALLLAAIVVWWSDAPEAPHPPFGLPLVHTAPRIRVSPGEPAGTADATPIGTTGATALPATPPVDEPRAATGPSGGRAVVEESSRRSLHLRLVDTRGDPVSAVVLRFEDASGRHLPVELEGVLSTGAETGPGGEVLVGGLPAERVLVHAFRPEAQLGMLPAALGSFDLTQPLDEVQVVVLPDGLRRRTVHVELLSGPSPRPPEILAVHDGAFGRGWFPGAEDRHAPPTEVEVFVLHDGVVVATGTCRPVGDRQYHCVTDTSAGPGFGTLPSALLVFPLWQVPLRLEFASEGHRPQTVDLEPADGDVSLVVTLVREP